MLRCVLGKLEHLQNKCTSLWNFVLNYGLGKFGHGPSSDAKRDINNDQRQPVIDSTRRYGTWRTWPGAMFIDGWPPTVCTARWSTGRQTVSRGPSALADLLDYPTMTHQRSQCWAYCNPEAAESVIDLYVNYSLKSASSSSSVVIVVSQHNTTMAYYNVHIHGGQKKLHPNCTFLIHHIDATVQDQMKRISPEYSELRE